MTSAVPLITVRLDCVDTRSAEAAMLWLADSGHGATVDGPHLHTTLTTADAQLLTATVVALGWATPDAVESMTTLPEG